MSYKKEVLKLRAKLLSLIAALPVPSFFIRPRPKLVMTLLVRNEADIIRHNIEFHLRMGVDHIFATDNGSTDETPAILKEYAERGVLTFIHEPSQVFYQPKWVNRMADMAYQKFGSCFIFHCDGDEFWYSETGNLKHELARYPLVDCLEVAVYNVLPEHRDFQECYPDNMIFVVHNPLPTNNVIEDSKSSSLYLYPYHSKVFFQARKFMPHVDEGNHVLLNRRTYVRKISTDMRIYHFPVRGFSHFERKVEGSGKALLANTHSKTSAGWHWRRWYQSYLNGTLRDEYRLLVLNHDEAKKYTRAGVLTIDSEFPRKLGLVKG